MSWSLLVVLLVLGFAGGCEPGAENTSADVPTTVGDLSGYTFEELLKLQEEGAITQEELTAEVTRRLKEDEEFLAAVKGPKGPKGDQGEIGPEGPTGSSGSNGAVGSTGVKGEPGANGADGQPGEPGLALTWLGTLAEDPIGPALNDAYYNDTDGVAYVFDGLAWQVLAQDGATGADGAQGETGAQGPQGLQGEQGPAGVGVLDVPRIVAQAPSGVDTSTGLSYQVEVEGGLPPYLYYPLLGPVGFSLDRSTGLLQWLPTEEDVGSQQQLGLVVLDSAGLMGSQWFELQVIAWVEPSDDETEPDVSGDIDPLFEWYFPLVPTGQTGCYNANSSVACSTVGGIPPVCGDETPLAFCGQDAQYAFIVPDRFTISGTNPQNLVTDTATGLMWQQDLSGSTYTWQGALDYCAGLSYGGFSDWRLPTLHELLSIVDNGRYDPAIDPVAFPSMSSELFWSSSSRVNDSGKAWCVWFYYGHVCSSGKDDDYFAYYARCVRR